MSDLLLSSINISESSFTNFEFKLNKLWILPVIINWIKVPTTFEINQYSANPLGKLKVNHANKIGINHNIILFVDFCLSSIAGVAVVFCIKNVEAPTNNGKNIFV